VIVGLFVFLLRPSLKVEHAVAIGLLVGAFGMEALAGSVVWSPYYRINWTQTDEVTQVVVNGIPHQAITTTEERRAAEPTYFVPYERAVEPPERVLVIGAGTGADVAIALAEGAGQVDAVEIDPELYELGRRMNPERPYEDPRVRVIIDDGRAFLERSDDRYDLILFALTDSLTLVSGQSSLRLESYLFTREAMEVARDHLTSDGVFAMYNYYRYPWLSDRLANTLDEVYGHPPCFDSTRRIGYLALMTIGRDPSSVNCAEVWAPIAGPPVAPATDDHPFVYLREASIPSLYLVSIALILMASALAVRAISGPFRAMRSSLDLFFMGAAFLLLETKSVVQFALLFGTTKRTQLNPRVLYGVLAVTIAIAFVVPESALLQLAVVPRFIVAVAIAFGPVFCANLVFAERFEMVEQPTVAFGANLLGAMIGGTLDYASLVTGYRALLIAAALLYGLAFLSGRRYLTGRSTVDTRIAVRV
jgi:spermidine synthase